MGRRRKKKFNGQQAIKQLRESIIRHNNLTSKQKEETVEIEQKNNGKKRTGKNRKREI